jgi:hypothetical protein
MKASSLASVSDCKRRIRARPSRTDRLKIG